MHSEIMEKESHQQNRIIRALQLQDICWKNEQREPMLNSNMANWGNFWSMKIEGDTKTNIPGMIPYIEMICSRMLEQKMLIDYWCTL